MSTENDIQWALDLLTPNPNYEENFLSKYYPWIVAPSAGVGAVCFANFFSRRPVYAGGLIRFPVAIAIGMLAAKALSDSKFHREAERDQVMRAYIKLHPEDFPPPKRYTYGEVFNDWVPMR